MSMSCIWIATALALCAKMLVQWPVVYNEIHVQGIPLLNVWKKKKAISEEGADGRHHRGGPPWALMQPRLPSDCRFVSASEQQPDLDLNALPQSTQHSYLWAIISKAKLIWCINLAVIINEQSSLDLNNVIGFCGIVCANLKNTISRQSQWKPPEQLVFFSSKAKSQVLNSE